MVGLDLSLRVSLLKSFLGNTLCLLEDFGLCSDRFWPQEHNPQHISSAGDFSPVSESGLCLLLGQCLTSFRCLRRLTLVSRPLYNAELAPPEVRGFLIALQQLSTTIGIMLAYWSGVCDPTPSSKQNSLIIN